MPTPGDATELINAVNALGVVPFIHQRHERDCGGQTRGAREEGTRDRESVMEKLDKYHRQVTEAFEALRNDLAALKSAVISAETSKQLDDVLERLTELEQIVAPAPPVAREVKSNGAVGDQS